MENPEVVLVATPWPYYTMPSVQIATLKAYLNSKGVHTTARHVHLEVAHWLGYANYNSIISDYLEDGEALYGYLLFPELRDSVLSNPTFDRKKLLVDGDSHLQIPSKEFFNAFDKLHKKIVSEICKPSVKLIGFTLNFGQTVSSLYMSKLIKSLRPDIKIILGGAEASGELGISLIENFEEIDFVCNGEGEQPLHALAKKIVEREEPGIIPGIVSRDNLPFEGGPKFSQVPNLGDLPCPDFTDYFEMIAEKGIDRNVCRCLPIESSRGCYYSCSFCALNLQWENFREIPIKNVVSHIKDLSRKHNTLEFFFVDNITPGHVSSLCEEISNCEIDLELFYEARANLPLEVFRKMKNAGVIKVQLGIEALSTELLRKFKKKSTPLHNLQGIKNCTELGMSVVGNIIINYPSSTEEEVTETLQNLEHVFAYPPTLSFSCFAMEVGSPDYETVNASSSASDIVLTGNYSLYERCFPKHVLSKIELPRKEFRTSKPMVCWDRVEEKVREWENKYNNIVDRYGPKTFPLSFKQGADFVIVEDARSGFKHFQTLRGPEKVVAELTQQIASKSKIVKEASEYSEEEIEFALAKLIDYGYVASESQKFLFLPVRRTSGA